ncbi:MAG: tRNA (adenosine(37)-N6)-threonylcarbamoyltransferase complex ATPase subunit type 1 TsaE [Ilumatobacter sp.]|nr:tRNA (adenosine(37)-N6)-threonylcarbamoyltransferase complex ATPase subunit type 1 TsaE [Ilumatobacter sp.]
MLSLRVESLAGTHAVAAAVASSARAGDIIALAGEMGAGKTAFAQGFGRALGITDPMTSPTFTLVHSYPCPGGRLTLHHADLYRLERTGDVADLALHELAEFGGIVLVEWGDVAAAGLGDHLEIRFLHDDRPDDPDDGDEANGLDAVLDEARLIELHATGGSWAGRWHRLEHDLAAYRC